MKKKGIAALLLAFLLFSCGCAAQADDTVIVTSFYPMYVLTKNVADGIPGVKVVNMADQNVGCLHDYQLQTRDMVMLEDADALIVNGGGMEQFMDKIEQVYAQLPVINASSGIEMLCSEAGGHHHEHDHEDEHDSVKNAHVWLDVQLAIRQVENIAQGLALVDADNADAYQSNARAYIERLNALHQEIASQLAPFAGSRIITFHEAFSYFAKAYGLEVASVIAYEPGEEPGTREIAKTCDLVRELGIKTLFVEPQYPTKSAETIARETGASIDTLDPIVSGEDTLDSYENLMRENVRVIVEALSR